jgi:hypothetical protein
MAKKSVATFKGEGDKSGKNYTKCIKMVKSESGSYGFREEIVHNDTVKDFFK